MRRLKNTAILFTWFVALGAMGLLLGLSASATNDTLNRAPTLANHGFANAKDWPATFRPFRSSSIFNSLVPLNPRVASYSAIVIAHQFGATGRSGPVRVQEPGQFDYEHPIFYSSPTDPLVTLKCQNPKDYVNCGKRGTAYPFELRIPAKARPAGGNDAQMTVIAADGSMVDMWALYGTPGHTSGAGDNCTSTNIYPPREAARDWQTGDCLVAHNITNAGNVYTGSGIVTPPGANAAGTSLVGGIVTAQELVSGKIDHALYISGECGVGHQYPAQGDTQTCTSGVGPPLGGLEWYDVPCARTRANGLLQSWEKAILCALNQYGAYFLDNGSGGAYFVSSGTFGFTSSEEPWYDYDGPNFVSPFAALSTQGWDMIQIDDVRRDPNGRLYGTAARWRYKNGADWTPNGVDFPHHLHWLDACVARKSC
jgi:hypothetical protein